MNKYLVKRGGEKDGPAGGERAGARVKDRGDGNTRTVNCKLWGAGGGRSVGGESVATEGEGLGRRASRFSRCRGGRRVGQVASEVGEEGGGSS